MALSRGVLSCVAAAISAAISASSSGPAEPSCIPCNRNQPLKDIPGNQVVAGGGLCTCVVGEIEARRLGHGGGARDRPYPSNPHGLRNSSFSKQTPSLKYKLHHFQYKIHCIFRKSNLARRDRDGPSREHLCCAPILPERAERTRAGVLIVVQAVRQDGVHGAHALIAAPLRLLLLNTQAQSGQRCPERCLLGTGVGLSYYPSLLLIIEQPRMGFQTQVASTSRASSSDDDGFRRRREFKLGGGVACGVRAASSRSCPSAARAPAPASPATRRAAWRRRRGWTRPCTSCRCPPDGRLLPDCRRAWMLSGRAWRSRTWMRAWWRRSGRDRPRRRPRPPA